MKRIFPFSLSSFIVIALLIQFNGCSLIGLGIGAVADASTPKPDYISKEDTASVELGTSIDVILKSGSWLSGRYFGLDHVSVEEYEENYSEYREQNLEKIMLPELGEKITVITELGGQYDYEFFGVDYGIILLRKIGRNKSIRADIRKIGNIKDYYGNIIKGETVRELILEGKIPLFSKGIFLHEKNQRVQIPWESVFQMKLQVKKKGKLFLFLGGLFIDAFFVIAFLTDPL